MSGVFEMDIERAEKEFLEERKSSAQENKEPFVPSKALLLVQFGVPHILYHQGTALNYWMESCGNSLAAEEMIDKGHADGLYVWVGTVDGAWTDNTNGRDYDEWLETQDIRPATAEEWRAFTADETVWDHDEMSAWLNWTFKRNADYERALELDMIR